MRMNAQINDELIDDMQKAHTSEKTKNGSMQASHFGMQASNNDSESTSN